MCVISIFVITCIGLCDIGIIDHKGQNLTFMTFKVTISMLPGAIKLDSSSVLLYDIVNGTKHYFLP